MKFTKSILLLFLLGWGMMAYGQTYTHEGNIEDELLYTGKHTWRNDKGQQVAEVIYDAKGRLLSFMTWYEDEIMDAVKAEPDREIRDLPGLQYDDLEWFENGLGMMRVSPGNGPAVEDGQKITLHYQGLLQDGTQFDNSFERKKPFKFTLGKEQVIGGFEQAVLQMSVGEVAWVYVPHYLGYGEHSIGTIPPFSNLWYKLEVVSIK